MEIRISGREISNSAPPYIIAEAGANHDGELSNAKRLVDAAVESGADAVKFQNYTAERLVTKTAKKYWGERETTQYETFSHLDSLSDEEYAELADYVDERDITFFSTPFDREAVDLLERLDVPAYKIASGDLTHLPLLRYVAQQGKPMIVSTGMATLDEVKEALKVIHQTGNEDVVLLHCITKYPTPIEHINLNMMRELMERFPNPVGLSDHTLGTTTPIAAAAMDAAVIEKHFTYDKTREKSPDHRLSANVEEMGEIVDATRDVHNAKGSWEKGPIELESEGLEKARRSIVSARSLSEGEQITPDDVAIKRPGYGIHPREYWNMDDWRVATDVPKDTVLEWDDIETGS